jgi:uncharacterized integral membrane protein (TIGR00697 family)
MNEFLLFVEIIVIFSMVLISKKLFGKEGLMLWIGIASILANLELAKAVDMFGISATLGNILFASNFLAADILSECYGKEYAKKGVYLGLFSIIIYLISTQFALLFVPSEIDIVNGAMKTLFALTPRVCISSLLMYYIANRVDVYLFDKLSKKFKGKKLWLRNNVSTIICNCLENFGLFFLAFYGVFPVKELLMMGIASSIIEILIAICDTPFIYLATRSKE